MAQEKKEDGMEYRMLGGTGLKVSVLGFGCMTFEDVKQAVELLSSARKVGINFFDNAEAYGQKPGQEETIFGEAYQILLKKDPSLWRRTDVVISTKLFWGGSGENEVGLSQKHISEGIDASLKRLQLEYVDVLFAHRPDPLTSTEEIVRAFTQAIHDGKAFYWGTSEWPAHKIVEAYWIAKAYNLIAPIVEQPQYNLLFRQNVELSLNDLYSSPYTIGLTTWSPLHGGFLTGKYTKTDDVSDKTRANVGGFISKNWQNNIKKATENQGEIVKKLQDYAEKTLKSDLLTLALAWVIKNKNVSTMLLGASKPSQLEQNIKCLELARNLNEKNLQDIDQILGNKPVIPINPRRTLKKTF